MLKLVEPENLPDWTVFTFAGFLVGTVTFGVFLMTPPERATEPACAPSVEQAYLSTPTLPEPPRSALERPQEDWLWMPPQDDRAAVAADEDDAEPRRRKHRRRG